MSLAARVLHACRAAGIWFIVVPPRLTWRLQPLDTHCFLPLKAMLHQLYQQARARAGQDHLDMPTVLLCLYAAIQRVLCGRPWGRAFSDNGFAAMQLRVHADTLMQLRITDGLNVAAEAVAKADVAACFPATRGKAVELAWNLFLEAAPVVALTSGAHGNLLLTCAFLIAVVMQAATCTRRERHGTLASQRWRAQGNGFGLSVVVIVLWLCSRCVLPGQRNRAEFLICFGSQACRELVEQVNRRRLISQPLVTLTASDLRSLCTVHRLVAWVCRGTGENPGCERKCTDPHKELQAVTCRQQALAKQTCNQQNQANTSNDKGRQVQPTPTKDKTTSRNRYDNISGFI